MIQRFGGVAIVTVLGSACSSTSHPSDGGGHGAQGGSREAGGYPGGAGGYVSSSGGSPAGSGAAGAGGGPSVTGDCNSTGPYSVENQEPPCKVPYPGSLWTKPLPATVMDHLAPNSDAIARCTLTDCGTQDPANYPGWTSIYTPSPQAWGAFPRYYGNATDPLYRLEDCGSGTGMLVHIPSGVCFNQTSDHFLTVWDQTTDRTVGMYNYSQELSICLPPCTGMTQETACSIPKEISGLCDVSDWTNGPAYADGVVSKGFGGDSLGNAPWSLHVRHRELMEGVILHPLVAVTKCTVGHVFPALFGTYECSDMGEPTDERPATGALFFLDYSDAEIDAMALPAWQLPLVRAAARYGIYISDTNRYDGTGFSLNTEGGEAYEKAGTVSPVYDWLKSVGVEPQIYADGSARYPLFFLSGLPDIENHIHLADECVARGLAGVEGGCL